MPGLGTPISIPSTVIERPLLIWPIARSTVTPASTDSGASAIAAETAPVTSISEPIAGKVRRRWSPGKHDFTIAQDRETGPRWGPTGRRIAVMRLVDFARASAGRCLRAGP